MNQIVFILLFIIVMFIANAIIKYIEMGGY